MVSSLLCFAFFFSSGRRHTRWPRDWSSDVCSSDLFDDVVSDMHHLVEHVQRENRGVPVVLIGHSMGGMIAARYAQQHGSDLTELVLSAPVLGRWQAAEQLAAAEEIADDPLDAETLSRDPNVGADYVADPLVWHGPFKRTTVEALLGTLEQINASTVERLNG